MIKLYNPFEQFEFNRKTCFLSGEPAGQMLNVFPQWLSEQFQLDQKLIKLLDESIVAYHQISVPVSVGVQHNLSILESQVAEAFTAGYDSVRKLDDSRLFQWIGKLVFGMIHYEISAGLRQQIASGEPFNFSPVLVRKFSSLHAMLQSLLQPVIFEGVTPWSIKVFPVTNAENAFNYRDEINTLAFSLRMNDFGIIACLQDNGASLDYHKNILDKVAGHKLHPVQFEEMCARFFYSAYLFNRLPEYTIMPTKEAVYIDTTPIYNTSTKPVFDNWQVKTYGQVLENFWKPWGLTLFEIIKDPENPLSFLVDEKANFISADTINLAIG